MLIGNVFHFNNLKVYNKDQNLTIFTSLHPKHLRLTGTFECITMAGAGVVSVHKIYSGGNNNNNNREMVILSCLVVMCDGLNSS